ncbi:hypothetical protein [Halobacillus sp. A5]|uniref:hypothetical protein n=1 Tax=Halobacillus sp. A5 TaxID=2880263 RepID=UPI0020A6CCE9|nr:hypothetical protein [Halobacillus sp. A5]MCP3029477.1 hypothetical protein [Halobacillus sp. A5]
MNGKSHRIITYLLLLGVCLAFTACASVNTSESDSKDQNINVIESVLKQQFTGPDQELMDLLDDPQNSTIIGNGEPSNSEEPTWLDIYLEEKYQTYFSESMYDEFIGTYAMGYHVVAYNNDYQFEAEKVDIKKNDDAEGAYDFTVNVLFKKEKNGTEEKSSKVTGRININEEGKITNFRLMGDDDLSKTLTSDS